MTTTLYRLPDQKQIDRGLAALRLTMAVTAQLRREGWKDHEPQRYPYGRSGCDVPTCPLCTNQHPTDGYVPRHFVESSVPSRTVTGGGAGGSYPGTALLPAPTPKTCTEK